MFGLIGLAACLPVPPQIPVTGNTEPPLASVTPTLPALTALHRSALAFDGLDDYVVVADAPSLDLQNSFTIAAWVYLDSYTGWASLVTKGDKPNFNNYAIQQSEPLDPLYHTVYGRLRFTGCVSLPIPLPESQTVLSLRTWHFVAVTFDGQRVRFYTDGQPDGSGDVRGPLCANNKPLYIGADFPLTTEYWQGGINELQIWNAALSEAQIPVLMNSTPNTSDSALVGYWSFDEGSGSIAHDGSLYKNNGQLVGNPTWIQPAR
jgi:hypothetical protein